MTERRVLLLSTHQLAAFAWHSGNVRGEGVFDGGSEGMAAFQAYLAEHASSVFTLVANVAEESFQSETIPFLQSRDRSAVITRKLSQLFYTTPYTAAFSLGYEKTRRKDERLLLAALTATGTIDPWVNALREARVALAGIHSLPFLGEALLRRLKVREDRCIVLSLQDQSIRETYYERGKLHFSRLSPLANTSIGGIAQAFSTEAVKLQQYLLSQRQIARNQPLRAIVIAHPQALSAVDASCVSTDSLAFSIVSTDDCARQCGLKTAPADSHADALFAHLAIADAPALQFAKAPLRHDYRIWQIRNALFALGTVTLLACVLYAGKSLFDIWSLGNEAESTALKAQEARQRYEDIRRTFPPIPTDNETLRRIIDRYVAFERGGGSSPETTYREISAALAGSPAIDLDGISWKSGAVGPAPGNAQPSTANGQQLTQIKGTINLGARATPRQTLAAFDHFVADLRSNAALEVRVVQQPFDIDSGKSLRSSGDGDAESSVRPFALELIRKTLP